MTSATYPLIEQCIRSMVVSHFVPRTRLAADLPPDKRFTAHTGRIDPPVGCDTMPRSYVVQYFRLSAIRPSTEIKGGLTLEERGTTTYPSMKAAQEAALIWQSEVITTFIRDGLDNGRYVTENGVVTLPGEILE